MSPEQEARAEIDRLLTAAGWHVCDYKAADIHGAPGLAIGNGDPHGTDQTDSKFLARRRRLTPVSITLGELAAAMRRTSLIHTDSFEPGRRSEIRHG